MLDKPYIKRIELEYNKVPKDDYIINLNVIKNIKDFDFKNPVTFFVGENGLGKSTLLEAISTKRGFNAKGGSIHFNFYTKKTESDLNKYINLIKGPYRTGDGYFIRAESLYNVATNIDKLDSAECNAPPISEAYGGLSLHNHSHGESFLNIFFKRFKGNGLYILDDPEAAVSPVSQLSLLVKIKRACRLKLTIYNSYSLLLLAFPNSQIYEIKDDGIFPTSYNKTEHDLVVKIFFAD